MRRIRTLFKSLFLLLLLLLLLLVIALVYVVRSPFPTTSGTVQLEGLTQPVTVKRDELGVAHIYAENTADLFYAQGYTHAQDRFWQMEFWRHIGMGRLSEIVGPATLETDKFIRNVGWNRMALDSAENYRQNSPELWAILEAYSAGVNAWIADNGDDISINQRVLNLSAGEWEIEPWEPVHTVAWGVVMAWDLRGTSNMDSEQTWAILQTTLGSELADQLVPHYPDNRPVIVPSDLSSTSDGSSNSQTGFVPAGFDLIGAVPTGGFALGSGEHVGSNNWVVAGQHTTTGQPLLANDPHLGVQMPSIWYWNSLHAPGWDVNGMSFAGVPGVIIGHNDRIAWGVTNMAADSQDVYIEKLNPDNPLQYEFEGEWRTVDTLEETIRVNGGDPFVLDVKKTHHGPLIGEYDTGNPDDNQWLAMRWTAFEPSRIFESVIMLNQAQNYDEFRTALSRWDTSPQNIVYADVEGNIAYQSTGRYPLRRGWQGTQPVPGWTGEFEWDGFIPYDEMPRLLNPERGYIVTANHAIVDDGFPYYLARDWASGDRAQRITDLIEGSIATGGVSAETMRAIQVDNHDLLYDSFRPILSRLSSNNLAIQDALTQIEAWGGQLDADSGAAAIFEVFLWKLAEQLIADEAEPAGQADVIVQNSSRTRILLHALAQDEAHPFWDNQATDAVEDAETIVLAAMAETVAYLEGQLGENSAEWQWGDLHNITFRSNPLGESGIAPIESLVNRGPFPTDGGNAAANANSFGWGDNFGLVRSNPSMRMVIDLDNFDNSAAIHPTGQSGHPYHRNYDSMIDIWLDGQLHPMLFSASAIDTVTTDTLILEPR